jgi:hypothetical protein
MLCCNLTALNAQHSIPEFLNERSYTGGDFPVDESLVTGQVETLFEHSEPPFQPRSGEASSYEKSMPDDTPDPGASVPIDDACLFWIIVSTVYGIKIFFKKRKETLPLRDFAFKSKRTALFLSILIFFSFPSFSGNDYSFSFTADLGAAYLYGDVAGINRASTAFDDLKPEHIRYMLGGGIRHKINKRFSHKTGFAYGYFVAGERENTRLNYRGYAYTTQIYQLLWQPEFTFLSIQNGRAYLFSGTGIAHSSSKPTGSAVRSTDKFRSTEIAALTLFGSGYEMVLSERFSLGTEIVCYYYFSDFVDGISTKFSTSNDVAVAVLFSFSYRIFKDNGLYAVKRGTEKGYKCDW